MQRATIRRKRAFLRALAVAGLSQAAWAREQGISPAHLSFVLSGERDSVRLWTKIADWTRQQNETAPAQVA